MNTLRLLISTIIVLFFSGCSSNRDNIVYDYEPTETNSCLEHEDEILNQSGSADAPVLHIGIGIESGIVSLSWTDLPGAGYYVLEECDCPNFEVNVYRYTPTGNYYYPEVNHNTFFRVSAVISGGSTGWSNVVKNSY